MLMLVNGHAAARRGCTAPAGISSAQAVQAGTGRLLAWRGSRPRRYRWPLSAQWMTGRTSWHCGGMACRLVHMRQPSAAPTPELPAEQLHHSDAMRQLAVALGMQAFNQAQRSEEHTSELQSRFDLVCR